MAREELERLLAKEQDGELTPEEDASLTAEIDSDPDARRLAGSWRRTGQALDDYTSALGSPSAGARARVLGGASGSRGMYRRVSGPSRRRLPLAAAAGLLLALVAGFGLGAAFFTRPDATARGPLRGELVTDLGTLRQALRETQALMPRRLRWTALCEGQLSLGTAPLPLEGAGAFYFITYFVERSDRPRPMICQVAVLDGEDATVSWESDGTWSISCRPVGAGEAVRLPTHVSYRPEGSPRGVAVASEPTISGKGRVSLVSSRIGGVEFTVSVTVERGSPSGVREGRTL